MQQSLFPDETTTIAKPKLTADAKREMAKTEWLKKYPFKYHLFRVMKDELSDKVSHINSLYSDYNDRGYPVPGYDSRMFKYIMADTLEDVKRIIVEAKNKATNYYICTKLYDELIEAGIYDYSE